MKTKTKALALFLGAVLLVVTTVFTTMAYLTFQTGEVTNTFTVGKVEITLDEAEVDEYGVKDEEAARVQGNEYKLIPGHKYVKDPTVHVKAESEDCWLFVKVVNGLAGNEAESGNIAAQMEGIGWTLVSNTENIYSYKTIVHAGESVVVFEEFTLAGTADVVGLKDARIVITAYAVQADGFTTAQSAWVAAGLQ